MARRRPLDRDLRRLPREPRLAAIAMPAALARGALILSIPLVALGCGDGVVTTPDDEPGFPAIQEGNNSPTRPLVPRPAGELDYNHLGAQLYGGVLAQSVGEAYPHWRDDIIHSGVKRLQTSLNEVEPPIDWSVTEYVIPPEFDWLVDDMVENGVVVDYMLHFWDKDGQGEALSTPRFQDQEQVDAFLDFVRFIVRHFVGRIQYYTIWSEPDNCGQGGFKCIEPDDYIELVRQVVPVIREEDPQARVGLAPVVLYYGLDHLLTVLQSDVVAMLDVVQWHGQFTVIPEDPFYGTYYYDYFTLVEGIQETAYDQGFRGEYWSPSMAWCSEEEVDPPCETLGQAEKLATDRLSAKYTARGIVWHLGSGIGAGVESLGEWHGPWGFPTRRRLYTVMAGAAPAAMDVEISGASTPLLIRHFGFELPDGDRLFAIWTDGEAVEHDEGLSMSLTFPGGTATTAVGLDVLHGFEQPLVAETTSAGLLIPDLVVRDYPLILRLEG